MDLRFQNSVQFLAGPMGQLSNPEFIFFFYFYETFSEWPLWYLQLYNSTLHFTLLYSPSFYSTQMLTLNVLTFEPLYRISNFKKVNSLKFHQELKLYGLIVPVSTWLNSALHILLYSTLVIISWKCHNFWTTVWICKL